MVLLSVLINRTRRTAALVVIHSTTVKSADATPRVNGPAKTETAYLKLLSAMVKLNAQTNLMKEMSYAASKVTNGIIPNSVAVIQQLNSLARVDSA
jgi:hypothetical protein